MKYEFQILSNGKKSEFYKALIVLWMQEITEIEAKRDVAASRGQESAWRYWAGLEKGYKRAVTALDVKLSQMEEEGGDPMTQPSEKIEKLLKEARGETT